MEAYGLTGNIGCGKSTVAKILAKFKGVAVFDCDQISKELMSSGRYIKEINTILQDNVFDITHGNRPDLPKIAKIIFSHPERKMALEKFIHPFVWQEVEQQVNAQDGKKLCVVESAIIFETRNQDRFTDIITVTCNQVEQLRRLRENRKMSEDQIKARIVQQVPSSYKEKNARYVINTDCSPEQLEQRVESLYRQLRVSQLAAA